jgi:hypothetical protein
MLKANFKRSTIASRAILVPPRRAVVSASRRTPIISTRESARPDGFRSTIETMKEPAVAEDAVARKRIRDAMKTTSGTDDFWRMVNTNVVRKRRLGPSQLTSRRRIAYSPPPTASLRRVTRALSIRRSALAMQRRASSEASKLLSLKLFDIVRRVDRLLADAITDDPDG